VAPSAAKSSAATAVRRRWYRCFCILSDLPGGNTKTQADGTFTLTASTGTYILSAIDYVNGFGTETFSGDTEDLNTALEAKSFIGQDTFYGTIRLGGSPRSTMFRRDPVLRRNRLARRQGISTGWSEQAGPCTGRASR
jgi:hypothetical protein